MEKLEIKHIAPYLPYGVEVEYTRRIYPKETKRQILSINMLRLCEDAPSKFSIKPLLRPLSDLYKEIDGVVGIVELAKIATGVPEWTVMEYEPKFGSGKIKLKSYLVALNKEYNFRFFLRNKDFYLYDIDGLRECTHQNQLDLFTYLFQHHYDVFGLIDKGLCIYENEI